MNLRYRHTMYEDVIWETSTMKRSEDRTVKAEFLYNIEVKKC